MKKLIFVISSMMALYGCKKTDNNTATSSSITVSVTVQDAVSGLKIPYVSMERITQSNFATYQGYFGTTDSLGQFKFSESYGSRISFNKTGYYGQTWLVDYGNNPAVWNVKLKPMKKISVTGLVLDSLKNLPIDSVKITVYYSNTNSIGGGGGDKYLGGYSKSDGSFSFFAYIDKKYEYSIGLEKYGYYVGGTDLDTTKVAQNFTLKLARKAWYTGQKLPSKNNP